MDTNILPSIITNESDNVVYISDPKTYELIYLNKAARQLFNVPLDVNPMGAKCYEFLQGKNAPCEFCTNSMLSRDEFYTWEFSNPTLGKHFLLKDKFIEADGKLYRMEIATDITEKEQTAQELTDRLSVETTLVRCVSTLKSGISVDEAINALLKHIGEFYDADRAYILELDYVNKLLNNTYEWCSEGVTPEIDFLQNVPISSVDRWFEALADNDYIQISSVGGNLDHDSLEYELLEAQGIERLMVAPLVDDTGYTLGFIGVDDPAENFEAASLLTSISYFVVDDLEKRKMMLQLERMSYEDTLTGLKNRNCYFARLQELQRLAPTSLGVVYLDINGLKRINDTYGHAHGDEIIKNASQYLRNTFQEDIYRIGGDEFVTLCVDMERAPFEELVEKLREEVNQDETCSLSIGAKWDDGEIHAEDLIADADELMYINKQSYYHTSLTSMPRHRAMFVQELTKALNDGYYVVQLQPKVEIKTQRIYGAEALVRRREKDGTLTSPAKFIAMIEAEGAIRYIDFFVLEKVCGILQRWSREGKQLLQMAVNFSRITLMEENVVSEMLKVCSRYGIDPCWITIEVTESIGRMDLETLKSLIIDMTKAGFSISLDDFGSQYSNLAILASIDFDELKFDKTLVEHITTNEKSSVIIRHAIDMGKMLNKTYSTAEGIETEDQLDLLEDMDCDYGQGYYFSKPVSIEVFEDLVVKNNKTVVPAL